MAKRLQAPTLERVTTIREDGSRNFLRPADVRGMFTVWRRVAAVLLIAFYVSMPFIHINGFPAVFLDIADRRFHLFGLTFAAEDLWMLFFIVTGLGFTLFFVTALFGRLWCGWACPQTVFLEHVFRRIERVLEGPSGDQKLLDRRPWSDPEKILRRGTKHALFILVAAAIAHVFLAYFISADALFAWLGQGPLAHPGAFGFMVVMTGILYFNFSWFREQLCLIICPYGRLQSALVDDDTVVIGYDEKRGEPRGRPNDPANGDCIACNRCVQVCPTGIDIRQGLQIECIGCANCIDACNEVMAKVDRDPWLIRYDSLNALAGKRRRFLRPRVFVYFALMLLGLSAFALSTTRLKPGNLNVTRMTGTPFFVKDGEVRNQFNLRLINKRSEPVTFVVSIESDQEGLRTAGFEKPLTLAAMEETRRPFIIQLDRTAYTGPFPLTIVARGNPGDFVVEAKVEFLGPDPRLFTDDPADAGTPAE